MPRDSRMSRVLHVLIHMDRHLERPSSQKIAEMLATNPVVVRRMMSGLRDQGIVLAEKGRGGGWLLARDLSEVSLMDVYQGLGAPELFNLGPHSEHPECYVEQAVDLRLADTFSEAEMLIRQRFSDVSVADIADDFDKRLMQNASSGPSKGCI